MKRERVHEISQRGSGSILALMVVVSALVTLSATMLVSSIVLARAEARAAADTGAVAAAWSVRFGGSAPCESARAVVARYGGEMVDCHREDGDVRVTADIPVPGIPSALTRAVALAGPRDCGAASEKSSSVSAA
ncbi:Rv3654c family TadE-like protein [uncultured Bifidobacterium sp.]|uniref:Rv3654c family TadE-like protein n=1 Tax=uncultured Bifidobacterium sp. TaxID=165187 RepID=UPI00262B2718|nr:Rv3654c family TadE-like protein [uncultured Bifidobacterium sp.]